MADALDLAIAKGPSSFDFSPLSQLFGDYVKGRQQREQLRQIDEAGALREGNLAFNKNLPAGLSPTGQPAIPSQPVIQSAPLAPPQLAPVILAAAKQSGVDPELLTRQLHAESGLNPNVSPSPKGALGIAQFMPETAKDRGVNPNDPVSAINGAAGYMADLKKQFGNNDGVALAAYNWGPGNVAKWIEGGADPSKIPAETQAYVQKVTGKPIAQWTGQGGQAPAGQQNLIFGRYTPDQALQLSNSLKSRAVELAGNPYTAPQGQIYQNWANQVEGELAKFTAPPQFTTTGNDLVGNPIRGFVHPGTETITNPKSAPGSSPSTINMSAEPTEIAKQFDAQYPGVSARAEQMYRGEGGMPNSRTNKIDGPAMQLMQILHPDWNMTMWTAKNKMQQGLSSSSPSSLGGRLQSLRNAFDHLANTSDSAVEKNNYDLGNKWLSTPANYLTSSSTKQQDITKKMTREAVTFGGERTKFLTGSEGSEAERKAFLNSLGPETAAPAEMAGTIEGEYVQLKSALTNQEQQVREQLGEDYLKKNPIITPEVKKALDKIELNLKTLRGDIPKDASTQPKPNSAVPAQAPKLEPGKIVIQNGVRFQIQPDGSGKAL